MVPITQKNNTLRKAIAIAIVKLSQQSTADAIRDNRVPKGNVYEFSRAAGLLAVKKTSNVIPDCHPLPVEFTSIKHALNGLELTITVEVHTIYKTGVEVEAMHGAAITALTVYDMLKPIDKQVEIGTIRLQTKTGGKSGAKKLQRSLKCAVVVCSDSISAGANVDEAGKLIIDRLQQLQFTGIGYEIIPDDAKEIADRATYYCTEKYDLLLFTGGTGLSKKDVTPDAIRPLIDREIPGIMETARGYGQDRMPFAMLSRGVAGFMQEMLIITLPGSPKAAAEYMDALFPQVLHVFEVIDGERH